MWNPLTCHACILTVETRYFLSTSMNHFYKTLWVSLYLKNCNICWGGWDSPAPPPPNNQSLICMRRILCQSSWINLDWIDAKCPVYLQPLCPILSEISDLILLTGVGSNIGWDIKHRSNSTHQQKPTLVSLIHERMFHPTVDSVNVYAEIVNRELYIE